MDYEQPNIIEALTDAAREGTLDRLNFGVIGFDEDDLVTHYNQFEIDAAGLAADLVFGKDLFVEVAPCMNNFLVSARFDDEDELDEIIDYVLTLKMKPTKVRLRLLKSGEADTRFILVDW